MEKSQNKKPQIHLLIKLVSMFYMFASISVLLVCVGFTSYKKYQKKKQVLSLAVLFVISEEKVNVMIREGKLSDQTYLLSLLEDDSQRNNF